MEKLFIDDTLTLEIEKIELKGKKKILIDFILHEMGSVKVYLTEKKLNELINILNKLEG